MREKKKKLSSVTLFDDEEEHKGRSVTVELSRDRGHGQII